MASIAGMKHLGKVIRALRLDAGLTLEAVANQVPDYDSGNLSRFERGLQDIALPKLEALANVLNCPMHEMIRRADAIERSPLRTEEATPAYRGSSLSQFVYSADPAHKDAFQGVHKVPVLTDLQAARLAESADALSQAAEFVETTADTGSDGFAWRVPDDSMFGDAGISFAPGMTVFFKPQLTHVAGDCVLIALSASEVQFCQLTRAGGAWYMTSLNRRYPPRPLPEAAKILGVAIAAQFKVPRGGT